MGLTVLPVVGVKTDNVRYLTYYALAILLDFFIGVLQIGQPLRLLEYALEFVLYMVASSIRSRLVCVGLPLCVLTCW